MTEREKRNEVPEEDLYTETEFLVYGAFHEDDADEGFKATRWLSAKKLQDLDDFKDALEQLKDLLRNTRKAFVEASDDEESSASESASD